MESEFIDWVRSRVQAHKPVEVGIGDDAAVISFFGGRLVVTSDMLMDGVDFELHRCAAADVGRKSLAVNLSDLAAMAAEPIAAIVSLALPRDGGSELARTIYEGLFRIADDFHIAIAGGDTNSWDSPLAISITALGTAPESGPLLRSGAAPGDEILVTGTFGGTILGKHFSFTPRVKEAMELRKRFDLHAGIDVSDGLTLDLGRLAAESGCGAMLELSQVPIADAAFRLAEQDGVSPLDHALGDGEDFELVLAVSPDEAQRILAEQPLDVPLTRIGRFCESPGLWRVGTDGERTRMEPKGYEHRLK